MERYHIEEIFKSFNSAEIDKIAPPLEELGENYFSEADVKLVRIKFPSEIGN